MAQGYVAEKEAATKDEDTAGAGEKKAVGSV